MGFGVLNGISIGLLNLSLGFNSVGFYQVHIFTLIYLYYHYEVIVGLILYGSFSFQTVKPLLSDVLSLCRQHLRKRLLV
jgi:hypothetical protein